MENYSYYIYREVYRALYLERLIIEDVPQVDVDLKSESEDESSSDDSSDDDVDDFIGNERHGKRDVGKTNSSSKRAR